MTTNYYDTLIEIAEDCPVETATIPPIKGDTKTIAARQYEMIADHPYEHTSDDVLFAVHAQRHEIPKANRTRAREEFFAKDQPCLRASPLGKRYGWGIHSDSKGRVALVAAESGEYQALKADPAIAAVKAMRSRRAK